MNCVDFAREYITNQGFKITDSEDDHIGFRYQMNEIRFWGNEDENFFYVMLPGFTEVTPENVNHVKELCHEVNLQMKLVKLYVLHGIIIASVEAFFMGQEDFNFQLKTALRYLIAAKVKYEELDK